jgi:hypothetical protein
MHWTKRRRFGSSRWDAQVVSERREVGLCPLTMIGENRQLVTDEPVEFKKKPVEFKK